MLVFWQRRGICMTLTSASRKARRSWVSVTPSQLPFTAIAELLCFCVVLEVTKPEPEEEAKEEVAQGDEGEKQDATKEGEEGDDDAAASGSKVGTSGSKVGASGSKVAASASNASKKGASSTCSKGTGATYSHCFLYIKLYYNHESYFYSFTIIITKYSIVCLLV